MSSAAAAPRIATLSRPSAASERRRSMQRSGGPTMAKRSMKSSVKVPAWRESPLVRRCGASSSYPAAARTSGGSRSSGRYRRLLCQGSGDVVMFEFVVPPAGRVPAAHFHREVDEVVYGLEGTLTSTVDGQKHELRKGDSLFVPRGSVHVHENLHADTVRVLTVLTPGSIGRRYFEEVAAVVNGGGPPDMARIKQI